MIESGTQSRALVTGGAGFIGSHLVEHLVAAKVQVLVVDDLSTGREENLGQVRALAGERVEFVYSDLAKWLRNIPSTTKFDQIYHLAAAVGVQLVVEDPIRTIETNIYQTSAILQFALATNASLLVASTSEVYGKGVKSPFAEDDDIVYGPTSRSRWSYGCSKAIDEYLTIANHRKFGLPATIVRFFNTVGPRQVGEYGMVLPRFIECARAGRPLRVFGDGSQSRCFIDVRDVVPLLPKLLEQPRCSGRIFNIGSDVPISIMELAEVVVSVLDSDSGIEVVPYEEAYSEGFEDLQVRVPDLTRIREATGFNPTIGLEATIHDIAAAMTAEEAKS